MHREDEDDISDCDGGETVKASRVLGSRDIASRMQEQNAGSRSSSWWASWDNQDGALVPRKSVKSSPVAVLQRQRESSRGHQTESRFFSSATGSGGGHENDKARASSCSADEPSEGDPFGQFVYDGRSTSNSLGSSTLTGTPQEAPGRLKRAQQLFKGRNGFSTGNASPSPPAEVALPGYSQNNLQRKSMLKPFESPRMSSPDPSVPRQSAQDSQTHLKRPSILSKILARPPSAQSKHLADSTNNRVGDLLDSTTTACQTRRLRQGKVLDDSSEDEGCAVEVPRSKSGNQSINFSSTRSRQHPSKTVTQNSGDEAGLPASWVPRKAEGNSSHTAKKRKDVRNFFVPNKGLRKEQDDDQLIDLEDEDVTVGDAEIIRVARGTPVRARLRKKKTRTVEEEGFEALLAQDSPEVAFNQRPRRKATGRRPVIVDDDEDELADADVVSEGDESDGHDDDQTPVWKTMQNESVDPVTAALRKCEAIATTLQAKLKESVGDMQKDPGGGNGPGDGGSQCFSTVDDSGARLVTQQQVSVACGFTVQLKPYQLVGVNFLLLLSRQAVGGAILADEMGLGKTVQAISFLAVLAHLEKDCGPHLVVAPASLLENWQREIKRWCPALKVVLLHGAEREETRAKVEGLMGFGRGSRFLQGCVRDAGEGMGGLPFNVMLTCYSLFERDSAMQKDDRKFLRRFDFSCVLMDEAHLLKDRNSQRTRRLRSIASKARHRLMLTGTPLQNDLTELWCLLELLLPSIFGAGETSDSALAEHLGDSSSKDSLIERMKAILAPFVLRRMKADVMRQLSPKIQKVEMVEMLPNQVELYAEALENCRSAIKKSREAAATKKRKKAKAEDTVDGLLDLSSILPKRQIASLFTHLRKVANHPLLVRSRFTDEVVLEIAPIMHRAGVFGFECSVERVQEELLKFSDFEIDRLCQGLHRHEIIQKYVLTEEDFMRSAKSQCLAKLLTELKKGGHRPLIFSQWTSLLDILERVLAFMGLTFVRLDGSTQVTERQELVDKFNGDTDIFAFLLSTRAGGQGLNLTGADTVILHDVDFNPQMDRQAEDRAHRIGQTRPVTIIRLVCQGTVDENILKIAERKLSLDAALLSGNAAPVVASEEASNMAAVLSSLFRDAILGSAVA